MPHSKKQTTNKEIDSFAIVCKQEKEQNKIKKKPLKQHQKQEFPTVSIPSTSLFPFNRKSQDIKNGKIMTQSIASKCLKGNFNYFLFLSLSFLYSASLLMFFF